MTELAETSQHQGSFEAIWLIAVVDELQQKLALEHADTHRGSEAITFAPVTARCC